MQDKTSVIALVGLRCSGKTSVGKELAKNVGLSFVDLDEELARGFSAERKFVKLLAAGLIFERYGESTFRAAEHKSLVWLLERSEPCVIATGGGVVEAPANRELLRRAATCIWLRVPIAELERRMRKDPGTRPPILGKDPVSEIRALAARREPLYAEVANHTIDCGTLWIPEIVRRIEAVLPGPA